MVESNYDILGIVEGTTEKGIRDAFRRLALQFHSDRGGENEQFIKIKQAYDDLKIGKKYPDTDIEKIRLELEMTKNIFKKYNWPTIDVTRKSVEETAASVIKIYDIVHSR